MSRALLAERLRQLEQDGIVSKRLRHDRKGHQWGLTHAGEALREVIDVLGRWGLIYGRDKIKPGDRDSTVLMWALRRRVDRDALPPQRVVVRFDLSGVARCRTGLRKHWLVLEPSMVDVCYKDPGFPVDVTVTGEMSAMVSVYLGHSTWREVTRKALRIEGSRDVSRRLESWLQLNRLVGRDLPIVPPASLSA